MNIGDNWFFRVVVRMQNIIKRPDEAGAVLKIPLSLFISWLELSPRSFVPLATLKSKVLPILLAQDTAGFLTNFSTLFHILTTLILRLLSLIVTGGLNLAFDLCHCALIRGTSSTVISDA